MLLIAHGKTGRYFPIALQENYSTVSECVKVKILVSMDNGDREKILSFNLAKQVGINDM